MGTLMEWEKIKGMELNRKYTNKELGNPSLMNKILIRLQVFIQ